MQLTLGNSSGSSAVMSADTPEEEAGMGAVEIKPEDRYP